MSLEFLWYIPNTVEAGHRGDDEANQWTSLDSSAELAHSAEDHGWVQAADRDPAGLLADCGPQKASRSGAGTSPSKGRR